MANKQAAIKIIKQLGGKGFEALLAGGCVRDMLLGRVANDYDVATDARPDEIVKLFKRTLKVGAKFGVIIVLLDGKEVEVATFRSEEDYTDGRHPGKVTFVSAAQDASRRDFTINGMFYDPIEKKVIDHVDGRADLKKRIIRTIGRPQDRFGEDYLRILRAVRFATQLGFKIEPKTFSALCKNAKKITQISAERITMELEGIFVNPNRSVGVSLLDKSGLAKIIFEGLDTKDLRFAMKLLQQLPEKINFPLSLAGFFAGCDTDFAIEKCKQMRLSRNQSKHVKFLLSARGKLLNSDMSLADLKLILAEPYFQDLYDLQKAIQRTQQKSIGPLLKLKKRIRALGDVELKPAPLLNGHALIGLGVVPGPVLGQLASEMYIAQLEMTLQSCEDAEKWVKKWLRKHKKTKVR
jgi:poly(A) polymerase